jgi:hypothetical protein
VKDGARTADHLDAFDRPERDAREIRRKHIDRVELFAVEKDFDAAERIFAEPAQRHLRLQRIAVQCPDLNVRFLFEQVGETLRAGLRDEIRIKNLNRAGERVGRRARARGIDRDRRQIRRHIRRGERRAEQNRHQASFPFVRRYQMEKKRPVFRLSRLRDSVWVTQNFPVTASVLRKYTTLSRRFRAGPGARRPSGSRTRQ